MGRRVVDFTVTVEGSLALIRPRTPAAEQWLEDNPEPGAYWWKGALVTNLRRGGLMVEAMTAAGLEGRKAGLPWV